MAEEKSKEAAVESEQKSLSKETKSKKHLIWPWILGVSVIIFIAPLIILAFAGFVPGLSSLFGANKPKDLGVRWSSADYASYQQKTGGKFLDFANAPVKTDNPTKKVVFAESKRMDVNLTQEEVTAAINSTGWLWMPIKNAQIKFNDGGLEISGNVNSAYIPNFVSFIGGVGYSQSNVDRASSWAKIFGNPPIYIKANVSVINNKVALTINEAKISRFNVPVDIANKVILNGSNNAIPRTSGLDIKSAYFKDGRLHFVGSSPTTIYVKRN